MSLYCVYLASLVESPADFFSKLILHEALRYCCFFEQTAEEELQCLKSAIVTVSAMFSQLDCPYVNNDADGKEPLLCKYPLSCRI